MAPHHCIISIGRQYGSGGRRLGHALADHLGIAYYDSALLKMAAADSGLSARFIAGTDERSPGFIPTIAPLHAGFPAYSPLPGSAWETSPTTPDEASRQCLTDIIRRLAQTQSCVIIGRTANHILRQHPGLISIFVHAPEAWCAERIVARGDAATLAEARRLARRINSRRASYYRFYTDGTWGDAAEYDLTFDSSTIDIAQACALVECYMKARGLL